MKSQVLQHSYKSSVTVYVDNPSADVDRVQTGESHKLVRQSSLHSEFQVQ